MRGLEEVLAKYKVGGEHSSERSHSRHGSDVPGSESFIINIVSGLESALSHREHNIRKLEQELSDQQILKLKIENYED